MHRSPGGWRRLVALLSAGWVRSPLSWWPQNDENPCPVVPFYVLLWVGLVAVSWAFDRVAGSLTGAHRVRGCCTSAAPPQRAATIPNVWGYWPSVVGLFSFVWLELAGPDPGSVGATGCGCCLPGDHACRHAVLR